jgi:hypothetical protein
MTERRQVSTGRKVAFYLGYLSMVAAVGIIVWIAAGPWSWNWASVRGTGLLALTAVACLVLGLLLRKIGIRGLAGSLVILDPPRARADLEPWSRAAGGLVDAALSEAGTLKEIAASASNAGRAGPEVKVRCPSCKALNDEKGRFCGQCGKPL